MDEIPALPQPELVNGVTSLDDDSDNKVMQKLEPMETIGDELTLNGSSTTAEDPSVEPSTDSAKGADATEELMEEDADEPSVMSMSILPAGSKKRKASKKKSDGYKSRKRSKVSKTKKTDPEEYEVEMIVDHKIEDVSRSPKLLAAQPKFYHFTFSTVLQPG